MTDQNIETLLDSDDNLTYLNNSSSGGNNFKTNKNNKVDLWNKTDFVPLEIDKSKLDTNSKTYSIHIQSEATLDNIDKESLKTSLISITKKLKDAGYTLNIMINNNPSILKDIIALNNLNVNYYLPWKKFNPDVANIALTKSPDETAYRIAFKYSNNIAKLQAAVRAIIATNNYVHLGKSLNKPNELCILYNKAGTTSIDKNTDFKTCNELIYHIRLANVCNIPIHNIGTPTGLSSLNNFIDCIMVNKQSTLDI